LQDDQHVQLLLSPTGGVTSKSQLCDYQYRGIELEAFNLLEFITQTYEEPRKESTSLPVMGNNSVGRRAHQQADYIEGHPDHLHKSRVVQSQTNNILPNFTGQWFPHVDDMDTIDLLAAMMLMLLKPW